MSASNRRMRSELAVSLAVVVGVSVLMATRGTGGTAEPGQPVDLVASQNELDYLASAPADRCVFAGPDQRLCRWTVPGRLLRLLEESRFEEGASVRVLCELPSATDRAGACRVYPTGVSVLPPVGAPAPQVAGLLAAYGNVAELSHAVGDIPERCASRPEAQLCSWPLSRETLRAHSLESLAPDGGDVALRCVLPLDGTARRDGSCALIAAD